MMSASTTQTFKHGRRGFSLIEVLIAIFILGVGAIAIASLFPAGIAQTRRSVDDVISPIVANNAIEIIRSKVAQDDFGSFEQFGLLPPIVTVSGDWPWLRPSLIRQDLPSTTLADERSAIALFPHNDESPAPVYVHDPGTGGGYSAGGGFATAFGLPWNRQKYDDRIGFTSDLNVIITQQERMYPMGRPASQGNEPQYFWDCAFRRFQGRVYVAIFVYRISIPAGERLEYRTPPLPGGGDLAVPMRLGLDPSVFWQVNDVIVRGTAAGAPLDEFDPTLSWQHPGQWMLDQNNNVHRVLSGRRIITDDGVELTRPVPALPDVPAFSQDVNTSEVVSDIWYLPRRVQIDANGDGNVNVGAWVTLTPVYVTVKEL